MKNILSSALIVPFLIAVFVLSVLEARADYTGDLYQQGSGYTKKIYTFESKTTTEGEFENVTSVFKDLAGAVVLEERAKIAGSQLIKSEITQNQTKQSGVIEVGPQKITFTKTADGKTKTSQEDRKGILVSSAVFQKFVKEHWGDLSTGKTVDFRYAVWDRMETVGFSLSKTAEEDFKGQKVTVLKMKPSSFLIAALVKPLFFKFTADGSRLIEMNGRVAPKEKSGDSWKDLDAEVLYSYPAEVVKAAEVTAPPVAPATAPTEKLKKKK